MNERHQRVCDWAHAYLHQPDPWIVLDTETTGLSSCDEVIEIAIINGASGAVLFSSLIQPQDPQRPDLTTHIHGITYELLANAPTFPRVWPMIEEMLRRYRQVLVFNVAYDKYLLEVTARRYGYHLPSGSWSCLMEQYAECHGAWNDYYQSYTWQKLAVACSRLGVQMDGDYHRATADALATLGVLRALAARHRLQQGKGDKDER